MFPSEFLITQVPLLKKKPKPIELIQWKQQKTKDLIIPIISIFLIGIYLLSCDKNTVDAEIGVLSDCQFIMDSNSNDRRFNVN